MPARTPGNDPLWIPKAPDSPPIPCTACTPCGCSPNYIYDKGDAPSTPSLDPEQPGNSSGGSCLTGMTPGGPTPNTVADGILGAVGVPLPSFRIPGACGGPGTVYLNLDGSVQLQISLPPMGGLQAPNTVLTYDSCGPGTGSGTYGNGVYGSWDRQVDASTAGATITTGSGAELFYSGNPSPGGYYTPPDGAANSLQKTMAGGYQETQPNGFQMQYDTGGQMAQVANPSGATWTIARDGSGRPSTITGPGGTTSLTYDSNGLSKITDPAGRDTLFTVNSGGNLAQITTPEAVHHLARLYGPPPDRHHHAHRRYYHPDLEWHAEPDEPPDPQRDVYDYLRQRDRGHHQPARQRQYLHAGRLVIAVGKPSESSGRGHDLHLGRQLARHDHRSLGQYLFAGLRHHDE